MRLILILTAFVISISAQAQLGGLLQKSIEKGKQLAGKSASESVDRAQDKLDSTDFNYAISVIDNSGMMDIRDANENAVKGATAVSNQLKGESNKTPAQKCHELLNSAEFQYKRRWYRLAELAFLQAKLAYENEGLTGNINYSKVHADLGLLYASMGRFNSAEFYSSEALSMREQTLSKNSKAYASSLNNMAVLYQETAKFNEAEKYFEEALQTVKTQVGEQSQEYAIVLNNQAIFFSK
ncbi:MAG TPA: tetratricopeptide repeat protein, partial [Cyclobacteriaceae bacterium]|nr:tetratricopeptide repeat protein [Cyclobacteriaceae bacterium]